MLAEQRQAYTVAGVDGMNFGQLDVLEQTGRDIEMPPVRMVRASDISDVYLTHASAVNENPFMICRKYIRSEM